jgi:hypothetical protein
MTNNIKITKKFEMDGDGLTMTFGTSSLSSYFLQSIRITVKEFLFTFEPIKTYNILPDRKID